MITILFLADTHLGFDLPQKARVHRRRRGLDFFKNFNLALAPAFNRQVDLVIHGGDLLYRSKVPPGLVTRAFEPLIRIASSGLPVYVVPGNHERSHFKRTLFDSHPNLFVFDQPRTFTLQKNNLRIALAGIPFFRGNVREEFSRFLEACEWQNVPADVRLLCIHQPVDGATVGPKDFIFKQRQDTIDIHQIPQTFDAVLAGHVHRRQIIEQDLQGRKIKFPIIYTGSTERTSFAESAEEKGFYLIQIEKHKSTGKATIKCQFRELPCRHMVTQMIDVTNMSPDQLQSKIHHLIHSFDLDCILRLKVSGKISEEMRPILKTESIRAMAPPTMNISMDY